MAGREQVEEAEFRNDEHQHQGIGFDGCSCLVAVEAKINCAKLL